MQTPELGERVEEPGEGIRLRLHRVHAHEGGDPGQDLVAGEEESALLAVKARVLRGVSEPRDDLPFEAVDVDPIALVHAPEAARDGGHHLVVLGPAVLELEDVLGLDVAPPVEVDGRLLRRLRRVDGEEPPHQPLLVGDPEIGPVRLREPARVAEVVGVKMGHDGAADRPPLADLFEDPAPVRLHLGAGDAGVDHRPPLAVAEQPQVDVVEGEGKGHPNPADAVRDFEHVARVADGGEWMVNRIRGHGRPPRYGRPGRGSYRKRKLVMVVPARPARTDGRRLR